MTHDLQIIDRGDHELSPMLDSNPDNFGPSGNQPSPLKTIATLLKGRIKWAILLSTIGAICGGILGFMLAKQPEYRSVGMLQIKPFVSGVFNENSPLPMFDAYIDSQIAIMLSRRTIDMAMQNPDWKALGRGLSDQAIADFQAHLFVDRQGGTIVSITFLDPNPAAARTAVSAIIQAYQAIYDDANTGDESRRSQILDDLKTRYMTELTRLRNAMQQDLGPASVESIYQFKLEQVNQKQALLQDTQLELKIQRAFSNAATQPDAKASGPSANASAITAEMIAENDQQMRDDLNNVERLQTYLKRLNERYGPSYPEVIRARSDLEDLQTHIDKRVNDIRNRFKSGTGVSGGPAGADGLMPANSNVRIAQLRIREAGLLEEIASLQKDLKDLATKNMQIEGLKDDAANIQEQLDRTKTRIQQLSIENQIGGRISVISKGDTPFRPFVDKRRQFTILGTAGGMGLGFGIILLIAFLDQRVKNVADAQGRIRGNYRMLGVLPRLPDDISEPDQASIAAYCVHHIRTILQIGAGPEHQVIAVSSPSPGDGKTSLAVALGLSFAASSSKTLLIDCDVIGGGLTHRMNAVIRRKIGDILVRSGCATPAQIEDAVAAAQVRSCRLGEILVERGIVTEEKLSNALQQQHESILGLLDALDGEPLTNCIGATGTPNLDILPLGNAQATHAAQLSPRLLRRILAQARERYDTVLIDTGPVLGSLEACIAAAEADGVVLTVSRGGLRSLAQSAIAQLNSVGAHVFGIVFNRALADDISSSGFSSPISAMSVRANGNGHHEAPVFGGIVKLGPVARAVAANTATGSNGTS